MLRVGDFGEKGTDVSPRIGGGMGIVENDEADLSLGKLVGLVRIEDEGSIGDPGCVVGVFGGDAEIFFMVSIAVYSFTPAGDRGSLISQEAFEGVGRIVEEDAVGLSKGG